MSGSATYSCGVCGWSGELTKKASGIDLCPDCLATGLEVDEG